jgi:hypothetical protein
MITQDEHDQVSKEERIDKKANGLTKNGVTVKLGGFAEVDFIGDNTRSFEEIIGNRPVLRSDTLGGANGRLATSPRNSRITIDVRAPERNGIRAQYFGSIDFIGNEPAIGDAGTSELTVRTSPDARIFQMYFQVETPLVDFKVGQDWSRFGFMSQYSRAPVSVAATPATLFNRWIQASVSKQLRVSESVFVTPVFSVERAPQKDSNMPSLVAGVQVGYEGLKAPYNGSSSGVRELKPLSVQFTGVGRRLEANAGGATNLNAQRGVTGWGLSSSLFVPVLPSRQGELGHTAHLVVEGVTGAGIADFFNGLSWGICNPVCGNQPSNSGFGGTAFGQTNIDAGLAAVSSRTGAFEAIRTTSLMAHLSYYLPNDGRTWVGTGYGTIYSSNAADMTCTTSVSFCGGSLRTTTTIYTRNSTYDVYLFHDFTEEIRVGFMTNWVRTTYADGAHAENRRVQISFFYRF